MILAVLAVAGLSLSVPVSLQQGDSLADIEHVNFVLSQQYRHAGPMVWSSPGRRRVTDDLGQPFDPICNGDRDDVCFGGDPDAGRCPNFVRCHLAQLRTLQILVEAAKDNPRSGYLAGQAIYMLSKLDYVQDALRMAEACEAERWWCDALTAYALHGLGEDVQADSLLHLVVRTAPDSVVCAYQDATWLLGRWYGRGTSTSVPDAHEDVAEWSCGRREAVSDSLWWLADPLYSVPGNERWVEHWYRSLSARFYQEIREALLRSRPDRFREHLWARRVRRGPLDSYDSRRGVEWTSPAQARYHFLPDVESGDLSTSTWQIESGMDDEGFTSASGDFLPIPHQVARFRAGDSLRVAAAARVAGTRLRGALDARASFILTDAPGSMPVLVGADAKGQEVVRFLDSAPVRGYVEGLEVVTSKGVGWHRALLAPLRASGPEVSDLLLYVPTDGTTPADLVTAAKAMSGTTEVRTDEGLGIYWEAYEVPEGAELQLELSMERESGGLVDRLRGLLPGGSQQGRGRVRWTELAKAPTHRSAVSLDVGDLDDGSYTLVLRVAWAGQSPLERRRTFKVE